jgi:hypothetical protein
MGQPFGMAETFRDALLWHMDAESTTIAALAHGAGVSADGHSFLLRCA